MQPFLVPDDFRAFMKQVVSTIDSLAQMPAEETGERTSARQRPFLDAEDALQDETGYGGRIDGRDTYRFTYIQPDGLFKWEVTLREPAIRDIADGLLIEVPAERVAIVRTRQRATDGDALLVWGEYHDDALVIANEQQLLLAADALHQLARSQARLLRLWSAADDQLVAVIDRDDCALYVVESEAGYATSVGDRRRTDSFRLVDHDGNTITVPRSDCVPWPVARRALAKFLRSGELGDEVHVDGRIPSVLLMMGDVDRKAALGARADVPRELRASSLARSLDAAEVWPVDETTQPAEVEAPLGVQQSSAWARRLLDHLRGRQLVELTAINVDELVYHLGGLLQAHGNEAQHALETADWLANEIGRVRGVRLFATGGDLQVALRRSRD